MYIMSSISDRIRMKREACEVKPKLPRDCPNSCNKYKRYTTRFSNSVHNTNQNNQTVYYVNKSSYLKKKVEDCNVQKPINKKFWINTAATASERINDLKRESAYADK
jgi:hypothetical protein